MDLALAEEGVRGGRVLSLGAADQESVLDIPALATALGRILDEQRPSMLMTHPYEGGHPDHDTAALVAHAAADMLRAAGGHVPALVEMTSYHARGERLEAGTFLERVSLEVVHRLTPALRARKERMLAAFASQRAVLADFDPASERFRRAPCYDFASPPHPGPLWYERLGFGIGWPPVARRRRRRAP